MSVEGNPDTLKQRRGTVRRQWKEARPYGFLVVPATRSLVEFLSDLCCPLMPSEAVAFLRSRSWCVRWLRASSNRSVRSVCSLACAKGWANSTGDKAIELPLLWSSAIVVDPLRWIFAAALEGLQLTNNLRSRARSVIENPRIVCEPTDWESTGAETSNTICCSGTTSEFLKYPPRCEAFY